MKHLKYDALKVLDKAYFKLVSDISGKNENSHVLGKGVIVCSWSISGDSMFGRVFDFLSFQPLIYSLITILSLLIGQGKLG